MVIPARLAGVLTRLITLGVQHGRRVHDPTIDVDMAVLLDAIKQYAQMSADIGTSSEERRTIDPAGEILTVSQAAAKTGRPVRGIRKACETGRLVSWKTGNQWSIPTQGLNDYLYGEHHAQRTDPR